MTLNCKIDEDINESQTAISCVQDNLDEMTKFISGTSDIQYSKKYGDISSIGAHIRHIIDFYNLFLRSVDSGLLDYDDRTRNRLIEVNKDEALKILGKISNKFANFENFDLSKKLIVKEAINKNVVAEASSTYARELIFLVSHTVHHLGIIKTILSLTGANVCDNFGKAASTIIYESAS